jgi:hypothetical protein
MPSSQSSTGCPRTSRRTPLSSPSYSTSPRPRRRGCSMNSKQRGASRAPRARSSSSMPLWVVDVEASSPISRTAGSSWRATWYSDSPCPVVAELRRLPSRSFGEGRAGGRVPGRTSSGPRSSASPRRAAPWTFAGSLRFKADDPPRAEDTEHGWLVALHPPRPRGAHRRRGCAPIDCIPAAKAYALEYSLLRSRTGSPRVPRAAHIGARDGS